MIALSKDNRFHTRTKHIDIHYHFIHECVADDKVAIKYIPTDDNTSDVFTKALLKQKFCNFVLLVSNLVSVRTNLLLAILEGEYWNI